MYVYRLIRPVKGLAKWWTIRQVCLKCVHWDEICKLYIDVYHTDYPSQGLASVDNQTGSVEICNIGMRL